MKPLEMNFFEKVANRYKKTKGYYVGDKFNTPSPAVKLSIEKTKFKNQELWDSYSVESIKNNKAFKILYPLQVQPEENIDVWGRPRRNQLLVIKEIIENLPENTVLYVKPNPKPKYEVDFNMIQFLKNHKKVKILKHSVSMTTVFNKFDLIITVTGKKRTTSHL